MTTLSVEYARDLAYGDDSGDDKGPLTFVASRELVEHRWYTVCLVVFKRLGSGSLFGLYHNKPNAEDTMDEADEFNGDPVPVFPVTQQTISTVVYAEA